MKTALINSNLALDMTVFKYLVCAVSTPAIRLIEREWLELQDLVLSPRRKDTYKAVQAAMEGPELV
jgi:hypothetical protein